LNETVSFDDGSSESASLLNDKLESKLNVLNALTLESLKYFASSENDEGVVSVRIQVFGLIPVIGRLLISSRETSIIAKQLTKVFNYLENDQVNNLINILILTMNEVAYLQENVVDATGGTQDRQVIPLVNMIKEVFDTCADFQTILIQASESYTPAVISTRMRRRDM
jgi:hypothetical protein